MATTTTVSDMGCRLRAPARAARQAAGMARAVCWRGFGGPRRVVAGPAPPSPSPTRRVTPFTGTPAWPEQAPPNPVEDEALSFPSRTTAPSSVREWDALPPGSGSQAPGSGSQAKVFTMKRINKITVSQYVVALACLLVAPMALGAEEAVSIDSGDTAWMLTASVLGLMMTVPGIALFYGGMVRGRTCCRSPGNASLFAASSAFCGSSSGTAWPSPATTPTSAAWNCCCWRISTSTACGSRFPDRCSLSFSSDSPSCRPA